MKHSSISDAPYGPGRQDAVAIVGMSCIFPGAANLQTYWQNIISKVDATGDPPQQWKAELVYDPGSKANDRIYCKRGGYLKELAQFNPLEYGIMPNSIPGGDPAHFLALRVAYEALADAGYRDGQIEGADVEVILGKGVFVAPGQLNLVQHGLVIDQTIQILKQLHPEHTEEELRAIKQELKAGLPPFCAETVPSLVSNIITGRIANRLNLMGANYTVDAACASSLIAVDRAVQDLLAGKCDMALAGGIQASMPPLVLMVFCQLNALSREGQIRPFDRCAGGTLLGEGVGMVVLKRKEDAERDGDRIYALIRGVGVSSDGSGGGLLAPGVEGEALALKRAYDCAGISPNTVGLIEAHGTGIPLGDITEIKALSNIFGPRNGQWPQCAIGSVKSMISHLIPAAGIAGLIKAALAIYHKVLPPTLNCDEPNPELGLENTPFYINTKTRPWVHGKDHPRRAGVNAFGFGGINAHAILEEYLGSAEDEPASLLLRWETEAFIFCRESREGLIQSCRRLLDFIAEKPEVELKDLAYSLNCPLRDSAYRLAIVADSLNDLEKKLSRSINRLADPACEAIKDRNGVFFFERPLGNQGSLAFMFPGNGSQYVNMLSELCVNFPEVRSRFDRVDEVFLRNGREFLPSQAIFPPTFDQSRVDDSPEEALLRIDFAISTLFTADYALFLLLNRLGIRPSLLVGHSTGEFAAFLASGAMEIQDEPRLMEFGLRFQSGYNSLASRIPPVSLLAIGARDLSIIAPFLKQNGGPLQVAMDNCPHQMVLCGLKEAIADALLFFKKEGVICDILPFKIAIHTPLLQPICDSLSPFFHRFKIVPPRTEMYSCATAQPYPRDPAQIRELAINQWARPVRFRETIEAMYEAGARIFVEVGPKSNLTGFVKDTLDGRPHLAVPSNAINRSDLTQINYLVGALAAHHIRMDLDYLYARRSPRRVLFEHESEIVRDNRNKTHTVNLQLELPRLRLKADRASASGALRGNIEAVPEMNQTQNGRAPYANRRYDIQAITPGDQPEIDATEASLRHNDPARILSENVRPGDNDYNSRSLVMQKYLQTMERFLDTQRVITEAFLSKRSIQTRAVNEIDVAAAFSQLSSAGIQEPTAEGPFDMTIKSLTPGREATAALRLDLNEHIFLLDHTLGRSPSSLDKTLTALPVVPLAMSLEIMSQLASRLVPGKRLIEIKAVRAHKWIEVDENGRAIFLKARVKTAEDPGAVEVRLLDADNPAEPGKYNLLVEGIIVFGDEYPAAPGVSAFTCQPERSYDLRPEEYYDHMFHGPCFRCVISIDQFDRKVIQATLKNPQNAQLFRSNKNSELLTHPILLDGVGQVVGFWTRACLEEGVMGVPIGFQTLRLYRSFTADLEPVKCNAHISLLADGQVRADAEVVGSDGELLARLQGWEFIRFFTWTRSMSKFLLSPKDVMLSAVRPEVMSYSPPSLDLKCCVVADCVGGIWPRVLASLILNRRERLVWANLEMSEGGRKEWLLNRLAVKDAVRLLLKERHEIDLCPADVEIVTEEHGRPTVAPKLIRKLGHHLSIAISNFEGKAVAIAGSPVDCRSMGISIEHLARGNRWLAQAAFAPGEKELLSTAPVAQRDEWTLRAWLAKEAVTKALARGVAGIPFSLAIIGLRTDTGEVDLMIVEDSARRLPVSAGEVIAAQTGRIDDFVFAVSLA